MARTRRIARSTVVDAPQIRQLVLGPLQGNLQLRYEMSPMPPAVLQAYPALVLGQRKAAALPCMSAMDADTECSTSAASSWPVARSMRSTSCRLTASCGE